MCLSRGGRLDWEINDDTLAGDSDRNDGRRPAERVRDSRPVTGRCMRLVQTSGWAVKMSSYLSVVIYSVPLIDIPGAAL